MREVKIAIAGMHCASCPILVDDCMEDVDGVIASQTDLKSGIATVQVEGTVSDELLLGAVSEAGYTGLIQA